MTKIITITLESPIVRGDTEIKTLQLRKPKAGELRGLIVGELARTNADQLLELLPRISMPPLTSAEIAEMDAADFTACALGVVDFFMPTQLMTALA